MNTANSPHTILFNEIEARAKNIALIRGSHVFAWHEDIKGLLRPQNIASTIRELKKLGVDDYVDRVLASAESKQRASAKKIVQRLKGKIHGEFELGPLYSIDISLELGDEQRRIGIIVQNREVKNGVWGPEHHLEACRIATQFSRRNTPIVTFIDTPGADAGLDANSRNQAHSISRLIAVMASTNVPTIGIVYGLGYSGGAVPLATTNLVLAVRDGVFNTIQPKGLANIARQYNLSWQESARYVGVSPYELYASGAIDGVIDWDPIDKNSNLDNLSKAILSGVANIEIDAKREVLENESVITDYVNRVRTEKIHQPLLDALQSETDFPFKGELTSHPSVYTHAISYLRSLSMRCRIHSSTIEVYGRLAEEEIPPGDLEERTRQIKLASFNKWLNDPEKLIYNDAVLKSWKQLKQRQAELETERNRITTLILGDPQENFSEAKRQFSFVTSLYLYNRWKSEASFSFVEIDKTVNAENANSESVLNNPGKTQDLHS